MSEETYNGWSNRETWAIQLHLSNNEGDYRYMTEQAEEIVRKNPSDDPNARVWVGEMADLIKDWTEEVFSLVLQPEHFDEGCVSAEARMFVSDVGSWWRADFYEIAEHWIDEARESVQA